MKISQFLRFNYIRNHYLRFGIKGLKFYFNTICNKRKPLLVFQHSDYLYPIYLRPNTSDIFAFYQILFNQEYNIKLDFEPKVIIDLGANIGLSTVFFLNKYPDCKIFAVEPEKSNYHLLENNLKNYNNCKIYNYGIWDKPAILTIKDNNLGNWGFSVEETEIADENTIKAITLDEIIKQNNIQQIDILKIDIEGAEIELFKNNYEHWLKITKVIIIELHDWMRKGCAKQFFTTITKYDFDFAIKGENVICYFK